MRKVIALALIALISALPALAGPEDVAWKLVEASRALKWGERERAIQLILSAISDLQAILRQLGYKPPKPKYNVTVVEGELVEVPGLPFAPAPLPKPPKPKVLPFSVVRAFGAELRFLEALESRYLIAVTGNDTGYLMDAGKGFTFVAFKLEVASISRPLGLALRGSSGAAYPATPAYGPSGHPAYLESLKPGAPKIPCPVTSLDSYGTYWVAFRLPAGEGLAGLLLYPLTAPPAGG